MRIGLVSTMRTAVPPPRTGSVELLVGLLAREMTRRGHEVTVFAPGDSQVEARVVSLLPTGYHHDLTIWDWQLAEFMQLGLVYAHAAEFDVIHSHVYCYALPFTRLVRTPTVHSFHICPTPDFVRFCAMFRDQEFVLISEFQRQFFGDLPIADVVPNGIDTAAFPFQPRTGRYLAFIGDFHPDKGPVEAIRLARSAGVPIRLAGPDTEYFRTAVAPELDGDAEYVGEVDHEGKVELLSDALGLVFLPLGLEACPLVLLESMACGTPVLGLRRGPVPELCPEGTASVLGDTPAELARSVAGLERLDRGQIRRHTVERYDAARMADGYERIYRRTVAHADSV